MRAGIAALSKQWRHLGRQLRGRIVTEGLCRTGGKQSGSSACRPMLPEQTTLRFFCHAFFVVSFFFSMCSFTLWHPGRDKTLTYLNVVSFNFLLYVHFGTRDI